MEESRNLFGYGRVSAKGQNPQRQLEALLDYGVDKNNIFIDKEWEGL